MMNSITSYKSWLISLVSPKVRLSASLSEKPTLASLQNSVEDLRQSQAVLTDKVNKLVEVTDRLNASQELQLEILQQIINKL